MRSLFWQGTFASGTLDELSAERKATSKKTAVTKVQAAQRGKMARKMARKARTSSSLSSLTAATTDIKQEGNGGASTQINTISESQSGVLPMVQITPSASGHEDANVISLGAHPQSHSPLLRRLLSSKSPISRSRSDPLLYDASHIAADR